MSTVAMFNATAPALKVSINNGTQFRISGAAVNQGWYPSPALTQPTFTGSLPAQGAFGYGVNSCAITPASGGETNVLQITISQTINPNDSLQLYIFFFDSDSVSWVLLDNGKAVNGSLNISGGSPSS